MIDNGCMSILDHLDILPAVIEWKSINPCHHVILREAARSFALKLTESTVQLADLNQTFVLKQKKRKPTVNLPLFT